MRFRSLEFNSCFQWIESILDHCLCPSDGFKGLSVRWTEFKVAVPAVTRMQTLGESRPWVDYNFQLGWRLCGCLACLIHRDVLWGRMLWDPLLHIHTPGSHQSRALVDSSSLWELTSENAPGAGGLDFSNSLLSDSECSMMPKDF